MALNTLALEPYLRRRLGGEPSVPITTLRDQAGDHLVSMHTWGWLARTAAKFNLVAGRAHIDLPPDWGRARGRPRATSTDSLLSFDWVTHGELLDLRSSVVTDSGPNYVGAVIYATNGDGLYLPRAEIWPTPTQTINNAFSAPYSAGWSAPSDDEDNLQIPSWMEAFYLEVLFAFAQGYDDHDIAQRAERLSMLAMSPELAALKSRDGGVQPAIGQMRGGAMASEMYGQRAAVGIGVRVQGPS